MVTPSDFTAFLNPILIVLMLCAIIGGFFAVRNGRQTQLTKFQEDTNRALKERIEALEGKVDDLEKQNAVQQHIIDTVTSALEQEGRFITIKGDLVTISDKGGRQKVYGKRVSHPPKAKPAPKKEEV